MLHRLHQAMAWLTTRQDERGASLVEYALLVALIAVVMVGAVTLVGEGTSGSLDRSTTSIIDATR